MALRHFALSLACSALWLSAAPAGAAASGASASAFVSGSTVNDTQSGGATGVQAGAAQTVPSPAGGVFVSAQASSGSASLGMAGVARSTGAPG